MPFKIIYSIVAFAGVILMGYGFARYRSEGWIDIWMPPAGLRHLSHLLILIAMILMVASYARGHLYRRVKHPLFAGTKLWALAQLLVNGDLGSIILFGGILAWAVIDRITLKHRSDPGAPPMPQGGWGNDAIAVLIGIVLFAAVQAAGLGVPRRMIAVYMMICLLVFGFVWLRDIVPAMIHNALPASFEGLGLSQNTVYVLDFAFTFPLLAVGAAWLWRGRAWGYLIAGMMVIMLTIETAGIAVDQAFGHLHDPSVPPAAVPAMLVLTGVGLIFSVLFLRGINARGFSPSRPEG